MPGSILLACPLSNRSKYPPADLFPSRCSSRTVEPFDIATQHCHAARSATGVLGCRHSHLGTCGLRAADWRPLTLALSVYLEGPYVLLKPLPVSKESRGA